MEIRIVNTEIRIIGVLTNEVLLYLEFMTGILLNPTLNQNEQRSIVNVTSQQTLGTFVYPKSG